MDSDTKAIVSELQRAQRSTSGTRQQRRNDRLLEGMLSSPARKLATMSRSELLEQRERNEKMLQNTYVIWIWGYASAFNLHLVGALSIHYRIRVPN